MLTTVLRRSAAIILLAGLLLTAGCAAKDADQPATPGNTAQATAPVKIGTLATQDSLPLWVAEQNGYFTEAGLDSVRDRTVPERHGAPDRLRGRRDRRHDD